MADAPAVWTVFSGRGQRASSTFAALTPKRVDAEVAPPPPDVDAIAAAARAEGRREGEAQARQAAQAAAAAEREAAAAALAEARRLWAETESAALAAAFTAQVERLESRLAASLTRVLRPFLADALRHEAIGALHATLATLVADEAAGTIAVTGPADLVEALTRRLALPPGRLAVTTDGSPDLHIQINGTVVETRLGAWAERLAAPVEDH